jgi:flagellar FliJ protein
MAGFDFKFEALLKLRKMKQDQCERNLADRTQKFLQNRRQVELVQDQIGAYLDEIRQHQLQAEIEVGGLLADRRYLAHLQQIRMQQRTNLTRSEQQVNHARKQLAEAKKQTDIMDKLRERAFEKYRKEIQKRETIELDDLANGKAAWQRQQTRVWEGVA